MNFYYQNTIWVCLALIPYYIEMKLISTGRLNPGHRIVGHDHQINTVKKQSCPLNSTNCERVRGGIKAKRGQFPFYVVLQRKWKHPEFICGGSILNRYYILTAAHCFFKKPNNKKYEVRTVEVKAGILRFKETYPEYPDVQTRDVYRLIEHPDYWYQRDPFRVYNDIGLILLFSFLNFKPNAVMPIKLPYRDQRITRNVTLPGLGGYGSRPVEQLKYIQMPIVSKEECLNNLTSKRYPSSMLDNVICTLTTAEESACPGDSGGPAIYYINKPYVVGVWSWFPYDCKTNISFVLVHTDVRKYLDFINSRIHTLPWGGEVCTVP